MLNIPVDYNGVKEIVTMKNFLNINMDGKLIVNVLLPPLIGGYKIFTYKVCLKQTQGIKDFEAQMLNLEPLNFKL